MATSKKSTPKTAVTKAAPKKAHKKAAPKKHQKQPAPTRSAKLFSAKTMLLFSKACKFLKLVPEKEVPKFGDNPTPRQVSVIAYNMLTIIIEYANAKRDKNWKPDYHSGNRKYWTWHWVKADEQRPSGFGFSLANSYCDDTNSSVGSLLCFATQEDEQAYRVPLEELYIKYKL